ncbi:MAG: FAD-binding protein [Gemmatimonadetes bacterium]|nr:FAD-binding protein [Gemmatimonadota bacterium]
MTDRAGECTTIPADRVERWDDAADVVVVGCGSAGASAAIEAVEAGADVLVLERASGLSGTTTLAGGVIYLGGGTRVQVANGIEDTPEAMFDYLVANTPEPDEAKIRIYCEQSASHFDWLVDHGVPFSDEYYRGKHHMPEEPICLMYSGNEKAWPISERAPAAPRGHKAKAQGEAGPTIVHRLAETAERVGARVEYDTQVTNLVVDERGAVVGLRSVIFGEERFVAARRGVVLAAGAFSMNKEMVAEYCPSLAKRGVNRQGNPNDDGAAIQMGVAAGGRAIHMEKAFVTSPFYPPESLIKGILVNKHGKRFINEDCYHARTMDTAFNQPDGIAYLICDETTFGRPELGMQPLIDAWETIEEMERDLGLPEGSLEETIARYNEFATTGQDLDFHKHPDWMAPIATAPFAALQCSVGESYYVGFTLGGLDVSVDAEVLGGDGEPIAGLYAAGACASNIAQDGKGYSSGTCIGEATFFGRRGGRHAAQRV